MFAKTTKMATITLYSDKGTGYSYEKYVNKLPAYNQYGFNTNGVTLVKGYPQTELTSTVFSKLFVTIKESSWFIPD